MKETKNITEGAVLLGIYALLLLLTLYIPFLGMITLVPMVVPFVVYAAKNGWKASIWLVIAANVLTILLGTPVALILSAPISTAGVVMGHLIAKGTNRYGILGAVTGAYLANYIIAYVVAIALFNIDIQEILQEMMRESFVASEAFASALGQQNTEEAMARLEEYISYSIYLLPTLFVLFAFVQAFISQWFSVFVVRKLKIQVRDFPPFRELVLPRSLLWYYLIVLILSIMQIEEGTTTYIAVLNLSFILMLLMTVQGLSFIFFFCHEKKITKAVPITILILSFLLPPLLYIIRMVGIVDIGFHLRERIQRKQ